MHGDDPSRDPDATLELNRGTSANPSAPPRRKTLGEFEIVGELGRGGMGVVYEAYQSSLDRRVALKVLPSAFGVHAQARERFEREARAAARLQHPNIVAVHAIGEDGGQSFYAMELVDGVSLDRVLEGLSAGRWHEPLSRSLEGERTKVESEFHTGGRGWSDTVSALLAEVADGLEYAHSQGVVHRDIKPANLMLSSQGHVRITDFGLARLAQEPGMTVSGALVGTPAYMSPEQVAAGRMPLDHRTDIYSLGAVLYEMLTLQRPFDGKSREDVIGSVLTKDPPAPRRLKSAIPQDLETICLKALEKDPDRRYQTAGEMARDLREYLRHGMIQARPLGPWRRALRSIRRHPTISSVASLGAVLLVLAALNWGRLQNLWAPPEALQIQRLAVLPFRSAAGDAEGELYADGLTEVLIAELGQLHGLEVIARRSAMTYKGSAKPIREIARELNADALVEGSLLRSEGRVRITATLIDASTERQLWGDRYDRSPRDILMLQGEVAQGIANHIRMELTPEERGLLAADRVVSVEAHKSYLVGKALVDRWTREDVEKGIGYLQEALEQDPNFAQAYAGLAMADVFSASVGGGWNAPADAMVKAREAANKALGIDPSLAEAHTAKATVSFWFDWDAEAAERSYRRAIELNPNFGDARCFYGVLLRLQGPQRYPEAFDQIELAIQIDPLNPFYRVHLAWLDLVAGKLDKVGEECDKLFELHPDPLLEAQGVLAQAFVAGAQGRPEEESRLIERCVELTQRKHPDMLTFLGVNYESQGRHADAVEIMDELRVISKERYVSPVLFAELAGSMGDIDGAFAYLEQAFEARCGYLLMTQGAFPYLESDPRWDELVKRIQPLRDVSEI